MFLLIFSILTKFYLMGYSYFLKSLVITVWRGAFHLHKLSFNLSFHFTSAISGFVPKKCDFSRPSKSLHCCWTVLELLAWIFWCILLTVSFRWNDAKITPDKSLPIILSFHCLLVKFVHSAGAAIRIWQMQLVFSNNLRLTITIRFFMVSCVPLSST